MIFNLVLFAISITGPNVGIGYLQIHGLKSLGNLGMKFRTNRGHLSLLWGGSVLVAARFGHLGLLSVTANQPQR